MKIQITNTKDKEIEGYLNINFNSIDEQFAQLSNNCCELILAQDIFDFVTFQEIFPTIQKLITKLRIGGTMVVGGKDLNLFTKYVKNNLISEADASSVVGQCKSMVGYKTVENMIQQMNLKYTTQLTGIHYEISISR